MRNLTNWKKQTNWKKVLLIIYCTIIMFMFSGGLPLYAVTNTATPPQTQAQFVVNKQPSKQKNNIRKQKRNLRKEMRAALKKKKTKNNKVGKSLLYALAVVGILYRSVYLWAILAFSFPTLGLLSMLLVVSVAVTLIIFIYNLMFKRKNKDPKKELSK